MTPRQIATASLAVPKSVINAIAGLGAAWAAAGALGCREHASRPKEITSSKAKKRFANGMRKRIKPPRRPKLYSKGNGNPPTDQCVAELKRVAANQTVAWHALPSFPNC